MILVEISTFKISYWPRISSNICTCCPRAHNYVKPYYFLLILYNFISVTKLSVQLKSYGCNDVGSWSHRDCKTATASIKVNGREYAKNTRGYNVVVFDNQGELRKELWFHKFAAGKISLVKFIRKNNSVYLYRVLQWFVYVEIGKIPWRYIIF